MREDVKKLFEKYEEAFATFNAAKNVSFYAKKFIGADPNGAKVFRNGVLFRLFAGWGMKRYKKLGMNSAKILSLTETPISEHYTLVKTHYGVKFRKTGDKLIEFDVSYLVCLVEKEPKIILFISHEDEHKTMKELGLM